MRMGWKQTGCFSIHKPKRKCVFKFPNHVYGRAKKESNELVGVLFSIWSLINQRKGKPKARGKCLSRRWWKNSLLLVRCKILKRTLTVPLKATSCRTSSYWFLFRQDQKKQICFFDGNLKCRASQVLPGMIPFFVWVISKYCIMNKDYWWVEYFCVELLRDKTKPLGDSTCCQSIKYKKKFIKKSLLML